MASTIPRRPQPWLGHIETRFELGRRAGFPGVVVGVQLLDFDGPMKCCGPHSLVELAANRLTVKVLVEGAQVRVLRRPEGDPLGRWTVLEGAVELPEDEAGRVPTKCLPGAPSLFPLMHLIGDCPLPNPEEQLGRERQVKAWGTPRWHLVGNGLESWWLNLDLLHTAAYVAGNLNNQLTVDDLRTAAVLQGNDRPSLPAPLDRVWGIPDPRSGQIEFISRACGPAVERHDGMQEYWLDGAIVTLGHIRAHLLEATSSDYVRAVRAMVGELGFTGATADTAGVLKMRHRGSRTTWPAEVCIGPDYVEFRGIHWPEGVRREGAVDELRQWLMKSIRI